jgi:hypothetical protein
MLYETILRFRLGRDQDSSWKKGVRYGVLLKGRRSRAFIAPSDQSGSSSFGVLVDYGIGANFTTALHFYEYWSVVITDL